jgi:hypothetical protein
MISGFMCDCHGFLNINWQITKKDDEGNIIHQGYEERKSYTIINPGKNADGYWTNENLVQQLVEVIPLFEKVHPGCELLFCFDNSQNHHAKPPDGLVVSKLNLIDGGKGKENIEDTDPFRIRDTTFTNANGQVVQQSMVTAGRKQKGIKTILSERGLWDDLDHKKLQCPPCKNGSPEPGKTNCCAIRCLSEQPDFKNQKEWLREVVEDCHKHSIIFFPKFHCELNYIEMIWGYIKKLLRKECEFRFEWLQGRVPEILDGEIPLRFVQKVARHCERFMEGYRLELHGPVLDYAMKKYRGHRTIPGDQVQLIREEFTVHQAIKRENQLKRNYKK